MPEDRPGLRNAARAIWTHYRRHEIEPIGETWRRIWTLGGAARGLLLLLAATLLISAAPLPPAGRALSTLALFVIAWSATLAACATTRRGLVPLVVVSPWLIFYSVLAAGAWIATPIAVIPVAWILCVAWRLLPRESSRRRALVWWLAISAGAAYVSAGPMGLRRALGIDIWPARLLLAAALGSAALLLFRGSQPAARRPIGFAFALIGSLIATTAAIGASAWRDLPFTTEWIRLVFVDASAIVVLLWLWTAGSFAAGSLKFGGLVVQSIGGALAGRWVRAGAPIVVLAAIAARIWWMDPLATVDPLHRAGLIAQLVVSTVAIVWLAVQASRRAASERIIKGVTLWFVAWAVAEGLVAGADAVVAADMSRGALAGAALIAVAGGLFVEFGKMGRAWRSVSSSRVIAHLAFVAVALCCAVALMTEPDNQWKTSQALMALTGMVHLGVPLALYEIGRLDRASEPVLPASSRLAMFAAGYLCGLIALAIDPRSAWPLIAAGALIVAPLFAMRQSLAGVRPLDGALAGALFGGGLVAGWMLPYPPTVPFLPVVPLADVLRDIGSLGRPLLSLQHLWTLVIAWIVCAAAGWQTVRAAGASYQTR